MPVTTHINEARHELPELRTLGRGDYFTYENEHSVYQILDLDHWADSAYSSRSKTRELRVIRLSDGRFFSPKPSANVKPLRLVSATFDKV